MERRERENDGRGGKGDGFVPRLVSAPRSANALAVSPILMFDDANRYRLVRERRLRFFGQPNQARHRAVAVALQQLIGNGLEEDLPQTWLWSVKEC